MFETLTKIGDIPEMLMFLAQNEVITKSCHWHALGAPQTLWEPTQVRTKQRLIEPTSTGGRSGHHADARGRTASERLGGWTPRASGLDFASEPNTSQ